MCGKNSIISRFVEMGCCGCFGYRGRMQRSVSCSQSRFSQEFLLPDDLDDFDEIPYNDETFDGIYGSDNEVLQCKNSEDILRHRVQSGKICRDVPVKETQHLIRTEDENGNKMINGYVRECKIGSGSYGKVVLYRSKIDGKKYAIKAFHKSHLSKLRVGPSETAMTDVHREVSIMKMLAHPNIVNLVEVIDDPNTDHFYMVLEYVEGKWVCEGCGPPGGLGEITARSYLRDAVSGLMYLHDHDIVHGDIKPDNILVTGNGRAKIGDFSVSQVVEDGNDELRRSPGTPVFTAPECCLGVTYHGKIADIWALGVTLYCMVLGQYPFLGETLQETYDKIINNPVSIPTDINPQLRDLLEKLLCKDPKKRISLECVAQHPWVVEEYGSIPSYECLCKRKMFNKVETNERGEQLDIHKNDSQDP